MTAISQTAVRSMPPGTTPPFIIRYSASNVPILQVALAERLAQRAAALRLRHQLHPRRHGHRPGRADPLALRRQAAPDHGRPRPAAPLRLGPLAARREQRALSRPEPRSCPPARAKIGANEYPVVLNAQPGGCSRSSTTSRSRRSTAPPSTSATSPTCATATRRRPTWCTSTASARCCMTDPQERQRQHARRREARSASVPARDRMAQAARRSSRSRCSSISRSSCAPPSTAW